MIVTAVQAAGVLPWLADMTLLLVLGQDRVGQGAWPMAGDSAST